MAELNPGIRAMPHYNILILGASYGSLLAARQIGMSHPVLDAIVALVDKRLKANRKKAAA